MSAQAALHFIAATREHEALREAICHRDADRSLDELVRIGAEAGFAFSAEELQTAFRHDWTMRHFRSGSSAPMTFPTE